METVKHTALPATETAGKEPKKKERRRPGYLSNRVIGGTYRRQRHV